MTFREIWSNVVSQLQPFQKADHSNTNIDVSITRYLTLASESSIENLYSDLGTSRAGLTTESLQAKHIKYGKNTIAQEKPKPWYVLLLQNFKNPFVAVLLVLGVVSYITDDLKGSIVVSIMVFVSVFMRFLQEYKSSKEAEALKAMVTTTASVVRSGVKSEISFEEIVPGDLIHLSAGDMIPADLRIISAKDLFVSESALTGESMPVEKHSVLRSEKVSVLERNNLCFLGTNIVSGSGLGIVVSTGDRTFFGQLARNVVGHRSLTSFDIGVNKVSWLLIKFMLVMVPIVFLVNGIIKGDWQDAFLFAIAVAVGLTPEMLPMIVTANLAKGAMMMSKKKVVVKRLNAIQNLGAMDVLCTDKTGTLTEDKIILEEHLNAEGAEDLRVLKYAYLNSFHQTGLKNLLDRAILEHYEMAHQSQATLYEKVDEIPFDFNRRRMSVIVRKRDKSHSLICKGAVEEMLGVCTQVELARETVPLTDERKAQIKKLVSEKNESGFRVVAVAYRNHSQNTSQYSISNESDLIFMGIIAFLDPAKASAAQAIRALNGHGVNVKILTGDNDIVTRKICKEVGLDISGLLLGRDLEGKTEDQICKLVEEANIFAKLTPAQKSQIIKALQKTGHTVGFLGDGINDAPALRQADVGVSVDTATDIAKESADIILLEKDLLVLETGVIKGREVYGNIIKYIKMTASSNFGNVFSVLVASAFLPFLPMLSVHLLVQNLLYDFSQTALPWDHMDPEFLEKPKKWDPSGISKFMLFIGPISSIFDIITFLVMWYVFKANSIESQSLFQSGWFVEGLLSQTLIVHMIRTQKIPFLQSTAALPVLVTTAIIMAIGLLIPFTSIGHSIGLVSLPISYFAWLAMILFSYCLFTQVIKSWYISKFKVWL